MGSRSRRIVSSRALSSANSLWVVTSARSREDGIIIGVETHVTIQPAESIAYPVADMTTSKSVETQSEQASSRRWRLLGVLSSLALTLLLVTTNVRLATNSLSLHQLLFERNHVPERTGITPEDLRTVSVEMQRYFDSSTEPLYVEAEVYGLRQPLFSERETLHMTDVKGLFHLTWRIQVGAALFLVVMALAAISRLRQGAWQAIAKWVRNGALLTSASVIIVGLVSLVAFDPLFTLFHRLGFRNDFWQLDPRTDFLVRLYPFGFWQDVTVLIGLATLVEAGLLFLVSFRLLRRLKRQGGQ